MMGFAGRLAQRFLQSRLTPLLTIAALAAGGIAIVATPREEEPQISVPMIDVIAALPGASPPDVEQLLTRPLEQLLWEIPGVEHLYAVAGAGYTMVTVRFRVGEDQDRSVSRVHAKLAAAQDRAWPGGIPPLVKPHAIDDVPILTLTLSSSRYGSNELRQLAMRLEEEMRSVADAAQTSVIGGQPRQVRVDLRPARLTAAGLTPADVAEAIRGANVDFEGLGYAQAGTAFRLALGAGLRTAGDVGRVVVGLQAGHPVYLGDVAAVRDDFGERTDYVTHAAPGEAPVSAVTITLAKRPGANATTVARAALARVEQARGRLLPADVQLTETRNYGESAREKAAELIRHLVIATLSVAVLIGLFLGRREAIVVLVAVPVTLALTLFSYYALGYTLNRITLFALIFSIGILVDDAIVVVENVYRHLVLTPGDAIRATVRGVDEVGNPTILATFTVIAAILPMAFVRGLMGPYMRPIPVGASVAMLASLAVAFIVTPALAYRFLRHDTSAPQHTDASPSRFAALYRRTLTWLMEGTGARRGFYGALLGLLLLSVTLVLTGLVQVKMLPFDNKSEFQVILDAPEGTTLEQSAALAADVAAYLRTVPEVRSTQVYAGTAAPFNFNGLVRHYFLRRGPTVADVQVNLVPREERDRQSHAIAVVVRPVVDSIARRHGASAKLAEIPPGPPVLSTLVAEVYAATDSQRLSAATRVRHAFERTPGVVDIDWSVEGPQPQLVFRVDRARAAAAGVSAAQIVQSVALAETGATLGWLRGSATREGVGIVGQLPLADRATRDALLALPIATRLGPQPLARFVTADSVTPEPARYRRDLRPVVYVTGDVAGAIESPVYAIQRMNRALDAVPAGAEPIGRHNAVQPARLDETALKWDGEWQVTIEVFRDLGLAFAAVLLLIYVLVVWWFESFSLPLVIMAPIPLTLVGILPGHAIADAFFTATSMIGMIALAGIIVRNSILLVDFIQLREREGIPLQEAVIEAGTVRFRPIVLTAAAVVVGGLVMVLDPIFQGLAVALIAGSVVATLLTMLVVPMLYWELQRRVARPTGGTDV